MIKGKIALVTGGASGIGLACVRELLQNGARGITIADIDENGGQEATAQLQDEFKTDQIIFIKTDVTDAQQFENAFKKTLDKWKIIDILINNAGILNDVKWELSIAINCQATVRGTLLAFEYMSKDKNGRGGVIVNMASIYGLSGVPTCPIYSATKYFVVGLTSSLGKPEYFEKLGIKVVALCPGLTPTSLFDNLDKNVGVASSIDTPQMIKDGLARQRPQTAHAVAQAMVKLIAKDNGSLGVIEAGELYVVDVPNYDKLPRLV